MTENDSAGADPIKELVRLAGGEETLLEAARKRITASFRITPATTSFAILRTVGIS